MNEGTLYYRCSGCRKNVRDEDQSFIPELGVRFCPGCAKDMRTLERIAEGLRKLPDAAGQTLEGLSSD